MGVEATWGGWGHTVGQGHMGGWDHMGRLGPTGEGKQHREWAVTVPPLGSHLSIGGHQHFRPPVQINVGDQATENTVKLVAAWQEKLVFEPPAQQVPGGQTTVERLGSSAVPATLSATSSCVRSGGSAPAEA